MEGLANVLQLLKKYSASYFLCEYVNRSKLRLFFTISSIVVVLMIAIASVIFSSNILIIVLGIFTSFLVYLYFRGLSKDYADFYNNYPGIVKLLQREYLALRIKNIGDELRNQLCLNKQFLERVEKECDTYLYFRNSYDIVKLFSNPIFYILLSIIIAIASHLAFSLSLKRLFLVCLNLIIGILALYVISGLFNSMNRNVRLVKTVVRTLKTMGYT